MLYILCETKMKASTKVQRPISCYYLLPRASLAALRLTIEAIEYMVHTPIPEIRRLAADPGQGDFVERLRKVKNFVSDNIDFGGTSGVTYDILAVEWMDQLPPLAGNQPPGRGDDEELLIRLAGFPLQWKSHVTSPNYIGYGYGSAARPSPQQGYAKGGNVGSYLPSPTTHANPVRPPPSSSTQSPTQQATDNQRRLSQPNVRPSRPASTASNISVPAAVESTRPAPIRLATRPPVANGAQAGLNGSVRPPIQQSRATHANQPAHHSTSQIAVRPPVGKGVPKPHPPSPPASSSVRLPLHPSNHIKPTDAAARQVRTDPTTGTVAPAHAAQFPTSMAAMAPRHRPSTPQSLQAGKAQSTLTSSLPLSSGVARTNINNWPPTSATTNVVIARNGPGTKPTGSTKPPAVPSSSNNPEVTKPEPKKPNAAPGAAKPTNNNAKMAGVAAIGGAVGLAAGVGIMAAVAPHLATGGAAASGVGGVGTIGAGGVASLAGGVLGGHGNGHGEHGHHDHGHGGHGGHGHGDHGHGGHGHDGQGHGGHDHSGHGHAQHGHDGHAHGELGHDGHGHVGHGEHGHDGYGNEHGPSEQGGHGEQHSQMEHGIQAGHNDHGDLNHSTQQHDRHDDAEHLEPGTHEEHGGPATHPEADHEIGHLSVAMEYGVTWGGENHNHSDAVVQAEGGYGGEYSHDGFGDGDGAGYEVQGSVEFGDAGNGDVEYGFDAGYGGQDDGSYGNQGFGEYDEAGHGGQEGGEYDGYGAEGGE
ncbi:hypothetical protein HDV00_003899 [Rhizophlyctis rosea]|nr:hypothetical protein HDV00_003899 [Rhizophlyctis rosea]